MTAVAAQQPLIAVKQRTARDPMLTFSSSNS
jgi:hypothetical protein